MVTPSRVLVAVVGFVAMAGCSTAIKSRCPGPGGLSCMSQSQIYEAVTDGSLETFQLRESGVNETTSIQATAAEEAALPVTRSVAPGTPLFVAPEPMRIWFADWRDGDDDLHSESYVYIRVGRGTWRIGEKPSP